VDRARGWLDWRRDTRRETAKIARKLRMRLDLTAESRVLIDLKATGLLRAVAHDPTLTARPEPWSTEAADGPEIDVPIQLRFLASAIEPPSDMGAADRDKMRENMCGRDVLDAARFPVIELRARYVGTLESGRLAGDLLIRGAPRPVALAVNGASTPSNAGVLEKVPHGISQTVELRAEWEGRLTGLGVRPYKALLGALRLEDWIRLRVEGRVVVVR